MSNVIRFPGPANVTPPRDPAGMLRRAGRLTALGSPAFAVAAVATLGKVTEPDFTLHLPHVPQAAESVAIVILLLAAAAANAGALFLRDKYHDYSGDTWNELNLFIVNCAVCLLCALTLLLLAAGAVDHGARGQDSHDTRGHQTMTGSDTETSAAHDPARRAVLDQIRRLRADLRGADPGRVERAVTDSELRLSLGDLLVAERITTEEARAELGELAPVVFGTYPV